MKTAKATRSPTQAPAAPGCAVQDSETLLAAIVESSNDILHALGSLSETEWE